MKFGIEFLLKSDVSVVSFNIQTTKTNMHSHTDHCYY